MILVIVGTEKFQFDRLLNAIDCGIQIGSIRQSVFAQVGKSDYKPSLFPNKDFLSFEEMVKFIQKAKIVVMHAGVGSTLLCLSLSKIPILFPRYKHLGEHLDNHQVEFTKRMEKENKVLVAYEEKELIHKIRNYNILVKKLKSSSAQFNKDNMIAHLKRIIEDTSDRV